jgi:hypothetical protein
MPPYLAFQLYSVASEMPCLRARSAVFAPASCSRRTAMICSSVNLIRFIVRPLIEVGLQLPVAEKLSGRSDCPISIATRLNFPDMLY